MNAPTGYVVFAHGSRVESANAMVHAITADFARITGYRVEPAFLELAEPDLATAIRTLAEGGIARIVVIPYFLTLGIHLQRDLPRIAEEAGRIHTNVSIEITPPLDGHPALLQILQDRATGAHAHGV